MSLNAAGKKFLNDAKLDIENKNWNEDQFLARFKEILPYAIHDSELATGLGVYAKDSFNSCGIEFNKPISNAFLSAVYFMSHCYVPTINAIPREALKMAFQSYRGGRFETLKKGYFPKIYSHDIKSAYPHQMRNLIDLNLGQWKPVHAFDPEAHYGFYKVQLKHDPSYICLTNDFFLYNLSGVNYYTHGNQSTFLTQHELEFFKENNLGTFKVEKGWAYYPREYQYPLRCVEDMFLERKKSPMKNFAIKIVLNSLYGKMLQLRRVNKNNYLAGNLFNPIWASIITSETRLMLLEKALPQADSVVSFLTDCILSTKRISKTSEELGHWNYEGHGEGLVLGTGIYSIHKENPQENKNRFRGFNAKQDLFDLCNCYAHDKVARLKLLRPQTLGQSVLMTQKFDYKSMNVFIEQTRELHHDFDQKRDWEPGMDDFGDYLEKQVDSRALSCV